VEQIGLRRIIYVICLDKNTDMWRQ